MFHSLYMTPHSAHLSSLCPSCRHCTVHITDGSPLSVARSGMLCSDSFYVLDVSLISDLTMQFMSTGHITDHDCCVILDLNFYYIQDCHTSDWVGTGPRHHDSASLRA
jgi:hypothetical protein